ncbi:Txe/YoeB family addiction module toxin [Mucilaginibacter terrenus]|uniref:Putative mRNA interferase YoeB n=1 Tax=Mucilaginibacter terrenus TaxID=2482727 RepID=A0A3E2NLJ0_9SPHI|nr:Txe/YoeB family addiction module toxin [Mucilaginibacter terrenus]RFZ81803.1 Txe/YoeB family addiction module toxin [Mucilaginibacter terrenus]
MELRLTETAKEDIRFFLKSGQKQVLKKIEHLLSEIEEHPFTGIGKPEALKYNLTGMWSRRIDREHRIIYEVVEDVIFIHSLKGHYNK